MTADESLGNLLGIGAAREVCRILREVVFERRTMTKIGEQTWDEGYACHFIVDVEGWRTTLYNDCDELEYCEECTGSNGRRWCFDSGDRFGTDPVALLSTWEHQTLERLLKHREIGLWLGACPSRGRLS
jgi:probable phosphoglycerate mutase